MASVEQISLHHAAPLAGTTASATRVRNRLGMMLVLVVVAAGVAAASLAALLANQEAMLAVAAAAILLGVAIVVALSIAIERRRLRRESSAEAAPRLEAVPTPIAPVAAPPTPSVASANGSDLFDDPAPSRKASAPKGKRRKRGQGDELLDEILNWPAR